MSHPQISSSCCHELEISHPFVIARSVLAVNGVPNNAELIICSRQATKSSQEVSSRYNEVTTVITAYYALLKTLQQSPRTYFAANSEQRDCKKPLARGCIYESS